MRCPGTFCPGAGVWMAANVGGPRPAPGPRFGVTTGDDPPLGEGLRIGESPGAVGGESSKRSMTFRVS